MAEESPKMSALSAGVAYQLADVIITAPQFESITSRWLTKLLEWKATGLT
jgi:hypothetical protein